MDPRDAMQGSEMQGSEIQASETQAPTYGAERRQMDQAEARHGFRPLALPALAAAAQTAKPATKAVPRAGRTGVLAIVHEDAPID
ncbi:hypothetical protein [uncultured Methylobacterium sp.]|uniref:hypothetical protein n=1 Tax=uncultured Methylobacterium sp. TaxID=157278 RepID=UPI0035CAB0F3